MSPVSVDDLLGQDTRSIPALIRLHAAARPHHAALIAGDERLDFAGLDAMMDRVAAAILRDAVAAHDHPDKLHTVGKPADGHDIRVIDDHGREVAPGDIGELVGHSPQAMMTGYRGRPDATAAAEWHDLTGKRFLRTGDLGRFDNEGFVAIVGRKKDVIISGGFNVYPVDLEAALVAYTGVAEAAVVGVPPARWGETPIAFVVLEPGHAADPEALRVFASERLGTTQRIADVVVVAALPRSPIGKVLKRELRETYAGPARS